MLAAQLCLTLCDPMDCSLPGFSVHGISQARTLEWGAISFSRDLPDAEIKPEPPTLQEDSLPSEPPEKPYQRRLKTVLSLNFVLFFSSKTFSILRSLTYACKF